MSITRKVRARIAVIGIALSSLATVFNANAAAPDHTPTPAPVTAPAQTVTPLSAADRQLVTLIDELTAIGKVAPFDAPAANRKLDAIVAAVAAGANPHIRAGTSPASVFNFAIVAAAELQRPDAVAALIRAGAKVNHVDAGGLTAVDYAMINVVNAQRITRSRIDASLAILRHVENAGGRITNARLFQFATVKTHQDLAANIVGLAAMRDAGYVTSAAYEAVLNGPPHLAAAARSLTDLSVAWLRANGAVLVEYPDAVPGGPEPITVAAGETLEIMARRFVTAIGAADEADALRQIAARNNIAIDAAGNPARALRAGETILIPLPHAHSLGHVQKPPGRTMREMAAHLQSIYAIPNATEDQILDDLARLNNMTRTDLDALPDNASVIVNFKNDSFTHVSPLPPPPWAATDKPARSYVIIIESADYHGKQTYRVAMGTNYGINPQADMSQFLNWDGMIITYPTPVGNYSPSDALHILMNLGDNPLRDRIIFSHSMGLTLGRINPDSFRNDRPADSVSFEMLRIYLDRLERSRPIIFNAAGNEYPGAGRNVPPQMTAHTPRTINVGAVGRYPFPELGNGQRIIAPYSTMGGEICALLPTEYGTQMEGTSYTTPLLAGAYRQFVEWYGNDLSYEEIMAAGLMTADRNILDFDPVNGYYRTLPGNNVAPVPALFRTNGGGLPYSERCGPGLANLDLWNKTLQNMVTEKRALIAAGQTPSAMQSHWLPAGKPQIVTGAGGATEYVYRIRMPENMTLGRTTFLVPQHTGAHSAVTVKTPAGFTVTLPHSLYETISTHALAFEDVKAGDAIEIRTAQPLADTAAIIVRGHADGNMLQVLRDQLRRDGIMPAPLRTYAGAREVGVYPPPSRPIPPANDNKKNGENPVQQKLPPAIMPVPTRYNPM